MKRILEILEKLTNFLNNLLNSKKDGEEEKQETQVLIDGFKPEVVLKYPTYLLNFGNSIISKTAYGSDGKLEGVETDLKRTHQVFKAFGTVKNSFGSLLSTYEKDTFNNKDATTKAFQDAVVRIQALGRAIKGVKLLVIYQSGHGTQIFNGKDNDKDKYSEGRCLYDKVLIDDDTRLFITRTLGSDWRVIMIDDRCFSGGYSKAIRGSKGTPKTFPTIHNETMKAILPIPFATKGEALIKYMAACSEKETALDYGAAYGGLYSYVLFDAYAKAQGKISYADATTAARQGCGQEQTPNLSYATGQVHSKLWSDTNTLLN